MSEKDKGYDAFEIFEEIVSEDVSKKQPVRATTPGERKWEPLKLARDSSESDGKPEYSGRAAAQTTGKAAKEAADMYYEIEYDSSPIPGAGKFVLKSQKIEEPEKDEIKDLFQQMRDIARENRSLLHNSSKFYDRRIQQEKANIFYKQGMFMKDFEDDYKLSVPYSSYFPYYQMMGYDQLRTYFTWRSKVRKGIVTDTSLSYAYLYMYELLNNIGVASPREGLDCLMYFWREYRSYHDSIDKYVLKWLKDYHIYYELEESFQEFVYRNALVEYYPYLSETEEDFDLYCAVSKYDIRKSVFYTRENQQRIQECFYFTFERLKEVFAQAGVGLEEAIFQPTKNMALWFPFKDALFHPWMRQGDRRVVISEKEIYICSQNRWTFNTTLTTESGKQLVGYVMKQMEVALRQVMHFKYKLSANPQGVNPVLIARLATMGVSLEGAINAAVEEFYREATKTVVKVDFDSLAKIRQEALQTQEKLIVEEEAVKSGHMESVGGTEGAAGSLYGKPEGAVGSLSGKLEDTTGKLSGKPEGAAGSLPDRSEDTMEQSQENVSREQSAADTPWDSLKVALTSAELEALRMILEGVGNLKEFADAQGMMLEVLMDGISEKSMDCVGDSLFDEEFVLYEDYIEEVRRMVEK